MIVDEFHDVFRYMFILMLHGFRHRAGFHVGTFGDVLKCFGVIDLLMVVWMAFFWIVMDV